MKKILAILLIVMFVFGMVFVFASCGGTETETNSETETETETEAETETETETDTETDTETETETETETDEGEPEEIIYTIYVEDQFGNPIEGVNLQICSKEGFCLPSKYSDAEGVVKYTYEDDGSSFKVQINSVPMEDGYIMPEVTEYPFAEGSNRIVVVINKNETYRVTVSDLYGRKLSGILVELLDEEDKVVNSIITSADGKAEFIVEPGTYTARARHSEDNAAFKPVGDGSISFEKSKKVETQFVVVDSPINYTVNLNFGEELLKPEGDITVKLYNKELELVAESTAANDKVVFNVPNGNYYAVLDNYYAAPVEFYKNGKTVGEMTLGNIELGATKETPIFLTDEINTTLYNDQSAWYYIPDSEGKIVEIYSSTAIVYYNGVEKERVDGVVKFELKAGAKIKILTTLENDFDTITGKVYLPGSKKTPHEIDATEIGEGFSFDVKVLENKALYYSFVADKDGTVKINSDTENAYILVNGNPNKKSVKAGDRVVICFTATDEEHPDLIIKANMTFAQTQADYKVDVLLENAPKPNASIGLYKYNGTDYEHIESVTCDENGKYTFQALTETADYYIKAVCDEGYETQVEYIPFGDETELKIYIYHKRDGSQEYPFLVDAGEGSSSVTTVTIESGKTVCYQIFFVYGTVITIDNGEAKLEIIVNGTTNEILTGTNLSYVLSGEKPDTNTRVLLVFSMADENASGEVTLTIVAPQVGE
ncbi:MAG: carboxypeptidase regulatory-like domain-containing protein [Ruminococcaceae bacterium]|nr:carboxypeptidase regulatory-like domain-containing protein [Oscillospiraceae bacterium]